MILEGKFTVKAPIKKLWDTMLKPETLQACIPGAEKIDQLDEKTYDCVVKQKVGPISVQFKFKTTLVKQFISIYFSNLRCPQIFLHIVTTWGS